MTPLWVSVLSAFGGGTFAVLLTKILEELSERRSRTDQRTQEIVRAYAQWITLFERALTEWSGEFIRIYWENKYGKGTTQRDQDDVKRFREAVRECQSACWHAVLYEQDRKVANEVIELSRVFDWMPDEEGESLVEKASNFSSEARVYRQRIGKVIETLQSRYLKGWPR